MKAAVIVFPGTNRERDAAAALAQVGAEPTLVWHRDSNLPAADLIVLPGGFAYGDYLRTGAIAAHSPIMAEVKRAAERGAAVLGMCNGFQILCEAGLLPGVLLRNTSLKFVCRDIAMRVETSDTLFTSGYTAGQVITVPVAHGEGNWQADPDTVKALEDADRVVFRYADARGVNGSLGEIAGICSANRRVLGLMPHPENAIDPLLGSTDGVALFQSVVAGVVQ
ncbi:MAG: phosphoribosylformylglycinamidine synthase subunit PurQ [Alphaproteobacteria bacterium]|nr:phosphoribosylformylglycinamidine synthase subunit PurQ [Alphaproteobacteria bacterium]TAD88938.1 MAG: phosphoribosylformylglycinamidine synthase subunit PurQ [Alphaproteobacteria bacterium]